MGQRWWSTFLSLLRAHVHCSMYLQYHLYIKPAPSHLENPPLLTHLIYVVVHKTQHTHILFWCQFNISFEHFYPGTGCFRRGCYPGFKARLSSLQTDPVATQPVREMNFRPFVFPCGVQLKHILCYVVSERVRSQEDCLLTSFCSKCHAQQETAVLNGTEA